MTYKPPVPEADLDPELSNVNVTAFTVHLLGVYPIAMFAKNPLPSGWPFMAYTVTNGAVIKDQSAAKAVLRWVKDFDGHQLIGSTEKFVLLQTTDYQTGAQLRFRIRGRMVPDYEAILESYP